MHDLNETDVVCVKALTDAFCHPSHHHPEKHNDITSEKSLNECIKKYEADMNKDKDHFSCKADHYGYEFNGKFFKAAPYVEHTTDATHNTSKPSVETSTAAAKPITSTASTAAKPATATPTPAKK